MGHQAAHSPDAERDSATGPLNVASVFAQMFSELQYLATRPAFGMSGDEALAGLAASLQFVSVVQSVYLNAIRALAAHPEVVGAGLSGKQAVLSVLTTGLRVSGGQAARDYAAAVATADTGRLPRLGRSLLEGAVHREHVDVAASAVEKLPKGLGGRVAPDGQVGWTVIDRLLDERAREGAAGTVKELGTQLREVLDPDRVQDLSEDSYTRRRASHRVDEFGMFDFRFVLDPATGVQVAAALEAAAAPRPAGTAADAHGPQVEARAVRPRPATTGGGRGDGRTRSSNWSPGRAPGTRPWSRSPPPWNRSPKPSPGPKTTLRVRRCRSGPPAGPAPPSAEPTGPGRAGRWIPVCWPGWRATARCTGCCSARPGRCWTSDTPNGWRPRRSARR